ncbi:MAG: Membrane-bound lytic murein transglycosylase precursor [Planctomycetota bacterium]
MQGCSPRPLRALALIGSLAFFSALAGCKTEEAPAPAPDYTRQLGPGESALRKLDPSEWPDVGAPWRVRDPNLTQALDRSITWFGLPSSKTKFPFMQVCTWDQAAASAVAFKQVLQDSKDEASFVAALKQNFDVWQTVGWNGKGVVLFTGYYSPEFKGSLKQTGEFKYPLYKRPPDLVTDPNNGEPKGRAAKDGSVKPWPARKELEDSQAFKGTELVWLQSPLDVYIAQVNGSAKIILPDNSTYYVGYAGKTDRPYKGLGASCVEAGLIPKDKLSLSAIVALYQKDPAKVQELIWKNESYVFFTTYDGNNWPSGSLGFKVTEKETLATDKKVYPQGGVVLVDTQSIDFGGKKQRFMKYMLDQDTGGAIQAPGRADIYMGVGPAAEILAGGQLCEGTMYYLFLKPDAVSQFPLPASKKAAAPAAKPATATKQKGLKGPAKGDDANK